MNWRLSSLDADAKIKIKNVFHIECDSSTDASKPSLLREAYTRLRTSLTEAFPLRCETKLSAFGAFVKPNDKTGTIYFPPNHFKANALERTERILHERSHTVFGISHAGMRGAGGLDFDVAPGDDNGFTYEQAVRNAYCYGWLATALQPNYKRETEELIITPRRK